VAAKTTMAARQDIVPIKTIRRDLGERLMIWQAAYHLW
jgi:hypothetical protein